MEANPPVPDDIALANDRIVARVRERLQQKQGTIFESPDGDCMVIQLHEAGGHYPSDAFQQQYLPGAAQEQ